MQDWWLFGWLFCSNDFQCIKNAHVELLSLSVE